MSMPRTVPRFTVDEYLRIERGAEERHIFLDGEIYAMTGESDAHGIISVNVLITMGIQLKGSHCQARTKDTKVRSGPEPKIRQAMSSFFSYPDILVVCGEPEYHDSFKDVILNPTAILEVLSETTEAFDRGEKFIRYQDWNPTLREYVLVSQDKPQIEHHSRQPDGSWSYRRYVGLDAIVPLPSIGCTLKLADVYDRIVFSDAGQGEQRAAGE